MTMKSWSMRLLRSSGCAMQSVSKDGDGGARRRCGGLSGFAHAGPAAEGL